MDAAAFHDAQGRTLRVTNGPFKGWLGTLQEFDSSNKRGELAFPEINKGGPNDVQRLWFAYEDLELAKG